MPATTDPQPPRPSRRRGGARRSHGTGSLSVRVDGNGRETYYGSWYANGRRVKRRIGPKRPRGERTGLTRAQAEAELRRLIAETQVRAEVGERLAVAEVAARYIAHAQCRGRGAFAGPPGGCLSHRIKGTQLRAEPLDWRHG